MHALVERWFVYFVIDFFILQSLIFFFFFNLLIWIFFFGNFLVLAIVAVKEELARCEAPKNAQPVLEEFIPLKKKKDCDEDEEGLNCNNKKEKDCRDKKNWMSSVQLWNTEDDIDTIDLKPNSKKQTKVSTPPEFKNPVFERKRQHIDIGD